MNISPELKQWLDDREKHLMLKRRITEDGGHIMLRSDTYDPEALDEPLRSEAIRHLDSIRASNKTPAKNGSDPKVKFLSNKK